MVKAVQYAHAEERRKKENDQHRHSRFRRVGELDLSVLAVIAAREQRPAHQRIHQSEQGDDRLQMLLQQRIHPDAFHAG